MLRAWGERKRKGRGTLVAILTKAGLYTDIEQSTKAVGKLIKHCAVTRGGSHVAGVRTHVARGEWHIAKAGGGCVLLHSHEKALHGRVIMQCTCILTCLYRILCPVW